ncbi:hypothetical protein EAF04_000394 [Stromatinia cepivora]|nr:hypothetical protein EAF04_000394 [Stromatinia cepivora]
MTARKETPFAEKYGHPRGPGHEILEDLLPMKKSGLTPASPSVVDWKKLASVEAHSKLEHYQRTRFWGFTARELEHIGALADSRRGKWDSDSASRWADLDDVPLHPIFERQHWEREDVIPIHFPKHPYGDGDKYWEVKGNDDIWEALQPALKIATLVLSNTATWQWFDALINGSYEYIPDSELPDEYQGDEDGYWRFFPSNAINHRERLIEQNKFLDEMVGVVTWGLGVGAVDLDCFPYKGFTSGITIGPKRAVFNPGGNSFIIVAHDIVEPLLNPNLLPEDKALDSFQIAALILHELTHAMHTCKSTRDERFYHEPYFMDEPLAETGFSMQTAVFGGINLALISGLDFQGKSCGGMIQNNFPSLWYHGVCSPPVLSPSNAQKLWDIRASYPVPVDWFMALQHQSFWNLYVRAYGHKATHMGPKIVGMWQQYDDMVYATAPRGYEDTTPIDVLSLRPGLEMGPVSIENTRRRRVKKIMDRSRDMKPLQLDHYLHVQRPDPLHRATYSGLSCPRYEEIKKYFEENQTALGLRTMNFLIPSPLFRSYVVRHGGINITHREWTNFFKVANDKNELFSYSTAGHGLISLLKDGWTKPEIPIGPTRRKSLMRRVSNRLQPNHSPSPSNSNSQSKAQPPPHPSKKLSQIFAQICDNLLLDIDLSNSTPDYCKRTFFRECNLCWVMKRNLFKKQGLDILDMKEGFPGDMVLFERCIYWSGLFWDEAPEGMVRRRFVEAPGLVEGERKERKEKCGVQCRVAG